MKLRHDHRRRSHQAMRLDRCKECGRSCRRYTRRRGDSLCKTCLTRLRRAVDKAVDRLLPSLLARIR